MAVQCFSFRTCAASRGMREHNGGAEAALPVVTKVLRTLKHTEDATPAPVTPQLHALCDIALALAAALAAKHAPGALPPGRVPGDVPLPTAFYRQRPKADLGAPQRRPQAPGGPGRPRDGVTMSFRDPAPFGICNQRGRGARARAGCAGPACGVRRAVWPPAQGWPADRSSDGIQRRGGLCAAQCGCATAATCPLACGWSWWSCGRATARRRGPPRTAGPPAAASRAAGGPGGLPPRRGALALGLCAWPASRSSLHQGHAHRRFTQRRSPCMRQLAPALPLGEHLTVTVPLTAGRATAMQAARAQRGERSRAGCEEVTDLVYNLCNLFRASLWGSHPATRLTPCTASCLQRRHVPCGRAEASAAAKAPGSSSRPAAGKRPSSGPAGTRGAVAKRAKQCAPPDMQLSGRTYVCLHAGVAGTRVVP